MGDGLHQLGNVCTSWKCLAKSTPDLWTLAHSSSRHIDDELANSKHTALDVAIRLSSFHYKPMEGCKNLLALTSRWRTADIFVAGGNLRPSRASLEARLEAGTAPLLHSLVVRYEVDLRGISVIDLFQGIAPSLRKLKLDTIALRNWASAFLFNLTTLSLAKLRQKGPSLSQLLAILEACSDLGYLPSIVPTSMTHTCILDGSTFLNSPLCVFLT